MHGGRCEQRGAPGKEWCGPWEVSLSSRGWQSREPSITRVSTHLPQLSLPGWVHRAVALPAKDIRTGEPSAKYARAAPTHHGSPAFSFVEYGAREGEALYGQLSLLMRARRSTDQHGAPLHAVAYIKPWKAVGVDQLTGCVKLEELGNPDACVVIPIANLRRVVHVVQSFDREGVWLLNKWADGLRKGGV
ncbi:unnamed protein product [Closterium sp. NIES-65]|nr:unnamed protein product [Closterium sp. NIES-65]